MVRFVHISDPHFCGDYTGTKIELLSRKTGRTPTDQLELGMEQISRAHPKADFFLLTGDLTHDRTAEEYAQLRHIMERLTGGKPCYVSVGNHDNDAFWEGWLGTSARGRYDYAVIDKRSGLKIIALDSRGGPYGSGILSGAQLMWLRGQVSDREPCIILVHHTPHIGGIEYLTYQMQNPRELYDAVRGANVLGIFSGHTHISFESVLGEIPCHTAPSITFGIIAEEHSMTATDETGYNYCTYSGGVLTVENIVLPGTGASASLSHREMIAQA